MIDVQLESVLNQAYQMGLNNASKWHFERFKEKEVSEK